MLFSGCTGSVSQAGPASDRHLIDRCLQGDVEAWGELYTVYHDGLMSFVRHVHGRSIDVTLDVNVVEEIVGRVWYAVVSADGRILNQFDPDRGCRLATYLAMIARNEARKYFRSEKRRRRREALVSRSSAEEFDTFDQMLVHMDEFLSTLTRREHSYCLDVLLDDDPIQESSYTQVNSWQLRSRVRGKLRRYLEKEP